MPSRGNCGDCDHAHEWSGVLVCVVDGYSMVTGAGGSCPKWVPKGEADDKHMPAKGA